MTDQAATLDTQDKEALIEKALSLGLTQAVNMKLDTLKRKIAEVENAGFKEEKSKPKPKAVGFDLIADERAYKFFQSIGFNTEWLQDVATQWNFDTFEYMHKFRAFRCYRDGAHLDWIDINEVGLLNNRRHLCQILLKYQPVSPKRKIIDTYWR